MNEQLLESGVAAKTKTDGVSRTQPGRQFHQRKTREDGGNIVNGCRVAVQVVGKKKGRKVLRQSAEQPSDGGRGVVDAARTGRCQVGKKELSVLSCLQRTTGASKGDEQKEKGKKKFMVTGGHKERGQKGDKMLLRF